MKRPNSLCSVLTITLLLASWAFTNASSTPSATNQTSVIVAVGAAGEQEYAEPFSRWAKQWEKVCQEAGARYSSIGLAAESTVSDYDLLKQALEHESKDSLDELWIVFIGHGTFDGKISKFNLRGPDLPSAELASWLKPFNRPIAFINCTSSSGAFVPEVSAPGRIVITASKNGYEQNYARFGEFMSQAIGSLEADVDKDGQTSLLEAFLTASRRVKEFYETEGRLATEHAILDDNGDGRGTPADWFRGVRVIKKAADNAAPDGRRAHQIHLVRSKEERDLSPEARAKRDQLELDVQQLRDTKEHLAEDEYYQKLEPLLLELARLYEKAGK